MHAGPRKIIMEKTLDNRIENFRAEISLTEGFPESTTEIHGLHWSTNTARYPGTPWRRTAANHSMLSSELEFLQISMQL